jgi:hemerythrin-like domain-containing protein
MAKEALEIIKAEHRSVVAVLEAAKYLITEMRAGRLKPDFRLFWAMLAYIEQFPEGLHHPKEDDCLFARLWKRTREADALLANLETQHQGGPGCVRALQLALGHYEADPEGAFEEFALAVETLAQFNWHHMAIEENELMPPAERHLLDVDWQEITQAFRDNKDPMFGADRGEHFRALFRKIVNMAPPPLGLGG